MQTVLGVWRECEWRVAAAVCQSYQRSRVKRRMEADEKRGVTSRPALALPSIGDFLFSFFFVILK